MLDVEFKNPKKLPIEDLYLDGQNKIPGLSERWVENMDFVKYIPLKLKNGKVDESFDADEWMLETKEFNRHLESILAMEYHKFWSHVLYDQEFLNPMLFFLQESTPFYVSIKSILDDNAEVVELYEKVCRNALIVVCRLITNRESDFEFMSRDKHAEIIYKNFIISIPMIFDMLTLYGYNNKNMMQKIIDTLLKIEPKYMNDLKMGIKFIRSTFETMRKQLETIESENRELFEHYEDLTLYLMNIATTLYLLVDLMPNEVKSFCSRELFLEQAIAGLYDHFIPLLYQYSLAVDDTAWFLPFIQYARVELINCFQNLISRGISGILNAGEKNRQKLADAVLSTLTQCAGFKIFIGDYIRLHPIEMDLDVIAQCGKNIDQIKLRFVTDAFKIDSTVKAVNGFHEALETSDDFEEEGACCLPLPKPTKIEEPKNAEDVFQLETSKILELFPSFGVGYIRRLLAFYDSSSEKVVSKILEGSLDSSFKDCDEQEPYIPPEVPDKIFLTTGMERSNVTDGDKFDVLRNEEFKCDIKKNGKFITKKEPKTYHDLLNDKTNVKILKDRYQQYGLVAEVDEYDDEYDDSYDVFADSEPKIHMHFHGKMSREMLPDTIDDLPESEESEEEPPASETSKNKTLDFCENPEAIRARREQQHQQKMAKKFPNRPQPEPKTRDVVGAQKGQGQSNEVVRNRQAKNTNKSSRANHNRKAGSTFKQSRGMF